MTKVKQDVLTSKGTLVVATPTAPRAVPVPPAAPGSTAASSSAAATSPSSKPLAPVQGKPGPAQSYTLTTADVGRTSIQFGGQVYNLQEHLGRIIERSDVGHTLMESYTSDGWVLSLA